MSLLVVCFNGHFFLIFGNF